MADIARIKGNIQKMIAQNAPESDIDEYVASEGVTPEQLRAPDKYQQAAIDERDFLKSIGAPRQDGYTRRLVHGVTLGADNTIVAAMATPIEMAMHGTWDPREAYNYAKAREDLALDDSRKKTGALGTALEIGGGAGAGLGLARSGWTFARSLAPEARLLPRSLASAGDAAVVGGFSGGMEGNGLQERGENALKGFAVGGALGGVTPGALSVFGAAARPIVSNVRARVNPEGYAQSQVARAVSESGMTPAQVTRELENAAGEGQGMYTLADALGNPGQRMLSSVTRAPGEGRTNAVDFLQSRQGDQGRRVANFLREGFDSPQTAEQARAAMVENANFEAGRNYAPVKRETTPIDVTNPVNIANRSISPAADYMARARGALPTDLAARSSIEQSEAVLRDPIGKALKEARSYLAAPNLTLSNVNQAFRAKTNIDMMIAKATDNKQGALVAELVPIREALDEALSKASSNYSAARDAYRVAQQRINALDLGKQLGATPVQPEDAIRQFGSLEAGSRQPFRTGYADPYVRDALNAPFGADKTRPLSSAAVRQEFNAFAAPGKAEALQRRLGREQRMFETRNAALGGSKTADNLADEAALNVDPSLIGHVLSGNWSGAVRSAISAGSNALTGNTPQVRQIIGDILTRNGVQARSLDRMITETIDRIRFAQTVARNVGRGLSGGLATARPGQNQR